MITTSITTPHFQSRVQALLTSYLHQVDAAKEGEHIPPPLIPALTPDDSTLTPYESIGNLIAVTSTWIDLCSPDHIIADISLQVFNLEVAYAAFCGVQNVIVTGPFLPDGSIYSTSSHLPQFARAIQETLPIHRYINFQILLPMHPSQSGVWNKADDSHLSKFHSRQLSKDQLSSEPWAVWEAWNLIRSFCAYHTRLYVALVIPRSMSPPATQARWFAEPLKVLVLPESTFVPNKYSQPVLSKTHQALLRRYMRLRSTPWIILSDVGPVPTSFHMSSEDPTPEEAASISTITRVSADPTPHLSYIRMLQSKPLPEPTIEKFGAGYQDYLQMALQPLADNLESVTYAVFEKDPVKYEMYEQAISYALLDWAKQEKPASSTTGAVVIAVAGAGRGPLVTRALHAAEIAGVKVEVWAVEKNHNAYVLLQNNNREKWDGVVSVVKSDMRFWMGPNRADGSHGKVDILVSELLGSFGDNELSPECLDGVQHVLNPTHGISIPASYTPFLTPIATPKLYSDILSKLSSDFSFEMPYVVLLHSYDFLSYTSLDQKAKHFAITDSSSMIEPALALKTPTVLPAWNFSHPVPTSILQQSSIRRGGSAAGGLGGPFGGDGSNAHNNRFTQLRFPCPERGVCHGFGGYFESVLYVSEVKDDDDEDDDLFTVELSTNPLTIDKKSKDMISWFPIFFPIKVVMAKDNLISHINVFKVPITFPDNSELVISMWRQTNDKKVWYEWLVESYMTTNDGKRIRLGVSDLHSCKKNAVEMM
jgi:type II protein arginine methyltransferase